MKKTWNKHDARLAVEVRERNRIARATAEPADEPPRKLRIPRKSRADFIVRIESARGERMQVAIHRLFGRVRTSDGQTVREFCRGLEQLFTKSA